MNKISRNVPLNQNKVEDSTNGFIRNDRQIFFSFESNIRHQNLETLENRILNDANKDYEMRENNKKNNQIS